MSVGPPTSENENQVDPAGEVRSADGRPVVRKAPNAFRTISEVADDLHIPQHVLRFWETKFPQVKPLKRGGGRRYYRPDDIALLRRISDLLYIQGYTIKGVQRLLREGGGKLSDNIPPPAAEEKAGPNEIEADTLQSPARGLLSDASPPLSSAHIDAAKTDAPQQDPVNALMTADPKPSSADSAEIARLRDLLRETLYELEALRALLG